MYMHSNMLGHGHIINDTLFPRLIFSFFFSFSFCPAKDLENYSYIVCRRPVVAPATNIIYRVYQRVLTWTLFRSFDCIKLFLINALWFIYHSRFRWSRHKRDIRFRSGIILVSLGSLKKRKTRVLWSIQRKLTRIRSGIWTPSKRDRFFNRYKNRNYFRMMEVFERWR